MDNFYRAMRQHFDVLMDGREPSGGAWNFDKLNRKPLPKNVQPPVPLTFEPDAITREVIYQVRGIKRAVGQLDDFHFAVTHEHAQAALLDFIEHRLPDFGPYEDAMSSKHDTLYHSVLSPYVNIGLLEPMEMIRAAEAAYREGRAPVHSVEGFVRQVLGWREYMYWQYWRQMPALYEANRWNATRSMPQMFWDANTDMNCIRCVTERVIKTGYSHHIERLMVICNFCLMAGVNPAQVADWFLIFYADAYEWVVLPNVIGMGLNADAGQTATKPYIASANYINKMSDYCKGCRYDPKKRTGENACPFNTLYWNFLLQNEAALRVNARMRTNLLGLSRLDDGERHVIQAEAAAFLESLHDYTD
jgi:deoxyribodipyrimidine photolyase-related protein